MELSLLTVARCYRTQITQHIRCGLIALALRDIAPYGRNVVYAGIVNQKIFSRLHINQNCQLLCIKGKLYMCCGYNTTMKDN